MNMTRKQFEMIAEVISSLNVDTEKRAEIASAFSDALASTNVRFNTTTFTGACINSNALDAAKQGRVDLTTPLFNKEQTSNRKVKDLG